MAVGGIAAAFLKPTALRTTVDLATADGPTGAEATVPALRNGHRAEHAVGQRAAGQHAAGQYAVGQHAVGEHAVGQRAVPAHAVAGTAPASHAAHRPDHARPE